MEQYAVLVVEDERMPAGHDWLLVEHDGGVLYVVRRDALRSPHTMVDGWAGYRHLVARRRQPPTLRAV